jgi:hypothetical protein
MPYLESKAFAPGSTGSQAWDFNPTVPGLLVGAALGTNDKLHSGQSFTIRESVTINVQVVNSTLIDTDFRWQTPLKYLGSWQVSGLLGFTGERNSFGLLHFASTTISRDHHCSVMHGTSGEPQLELFGYINQCNLKLVPKEIQPPGGGDPVQGYATTNEEPLFTLQGYRYPSQIENEIINTEINQVGVYCYAGVELVNLIYRLELINAYKNINPVSTAATCSEGGCTTEFTAWVLAHNGGLPIDSGSNIFSSQGLCQVGTNQCTQGTYVCTNGERRIYWYVANSG